MNNTHQYCPIVSKITQYCHKLSQISLYCSSQRPENIQFFLGTTITFQKLPTFLALHFSLYGLFQAEGVVYIAPKVAFSAFLYQICEKIIRIEAFHW